MIDAATVAYVAGVIDTLGVIRTRMASGTNLPYVAVSGNYPGTLRMLADLTGMKCVVTRREFTRAGCSEHCAEKHLHVVSTSGRWSVSGGKATVLLHNIRPYLRVQTAEADAVLKVGMEAPQKPGTAAKMRELGWSIPEAA